MAMTKTKNAILEDDFTSLLELLDIFQEKNKIILQNRDFRKKI
jgi:hypothetical protein